MFSFLRGGAPPPDILPGETPEQCRDRTYDWMQDQGLTGLKNLPNLVERMPSPRYKGQNIDFGSWYFGEERPIRRVNGYAGAYATQAAIDPGVEASQYAHVPALNELMPAISHLGAFGSAQAFVNCVSTIDERIDEITGQKVEDQPRYDLSFLHGSADLFSLSATHRSMLLNTAHSHNNSFASVNVSDAPLINIPLTIDPEQAVNWGEGDLAVFHNFKDEFGQNQVGLANFTLPGDALQFKKPAEIATGEGFSMQAEADYHVAVGVPGALTLQVKTPTPPQSAEFKKRGVFTRTMTNFGASMTVWGYSAGRNSKSLVVNGQEIGVGAESNFSSNVIRSLVNYQSDEGSVHERPYAFVIPQSEFDM